MFKQYWKTFKSYENYIKKKTRHGVLYILFYLELSTIPNGTRTSWSKIKTKQNSTKIHDPSYTIYKVYNKTGFRRKVSNWRKYLRLVLREIK